MKELFREYLGEIITALLGLFGMWMTNVINQRKMNVDIKSSELNNIEKSVEVYQKLLNDMEARFEKRLQEYALEISELKKKLEATK